MYAPSGPDAAVPFMPFAPFTTNAICADAGAPRWRTFPATVVLSRAWERSTGNTANVAFCVTERDPENV